MDMELSEGSVFDLFAGLAMHAILVARDSDLSASEISRRAHVIADRMMKERALFRQAAATQASEPEDPDPMPY